MSDTNQDLPISADLLEILRDPAAVQEQIANYRAQETDLVRSTVLDEDRADRIIALLDQRDRLIPIT